MSHSVGRTTRITTSSGRGHPARSYPSHQQSRGSRDQTGPKCLLRRRPGRTTRSATRPCSRPGTPAAAAENRGIPSDDKVWKFRKREVRAHGVMVHQSVLARRDFLAERGCRGTLA
jgi:hypothetical protein